jgi:hypothetical protein
VYFSFFKWICTNKWRGPLNYLVFSVKPPLCVYHIFSALLTDFFIQSKSGRARCGRLSCWFRWIRRLHIGSCCGRNLRWPNASCSYECPTPSTKKWSGAHHMDGEWHAAHTRRHWNKKNTYFIWNVYITLSRSVSADAVVLTKTLQKCSPCYRPKLCALE